MTPDEQAIVDLIAKRFIARPDVMAVQTATGYFPRPERFKRGVIAAHVTGERSFGHYLLDTDSTCKLFAFDLDLRKGGKACPVDLDERGNPTIHWDRARDCNPREEWLNPDSDLKLHLAMQLRGLAEAIAWRARRTYGFDVIVSYSGGKGMHVYVLCGRRPAAQARGMSLALLESWSYGDTGSPLFERVRGDVFWRHTDPLAYNCVDVELFPKQDELEGGDYGNLMRLPLGIHAKTRNKAFFVDITKPITRHEPFVADDVLLTLQKGSIRG